MLFNSSGFIFAFLPITLLGFHLLGKYQFYRGAIVWLVLASLFFYGWWNPAYLLLIIGSTLFNYGVGVALSRRPSSKTLAAGIAANLALLGYFKYANFFVDNLNWVIGEALHLETIILPLAISFFTFQQIAYLVDAHRGEGHEYRFLHYVLFVTFFPQLIAGPIVHHKEMMPQFSRNRIGGLRTTDVAVGVTIFAIGLFKKVVFADGISVYATPVFNAAEAGVALTFFEAWGGALAYTLQLYFDFSGYSDMAIGLARIFGIHLPLNFNSPYKSISIIEFWRRWHMTLSRFLRDYIYIPLGGNRKGKRRRNINIMLTMVLGGLWHGAGWTFVLWGGLHGFYLLINHGWRAIIPHERSAPITRVLSWGLTMLAIVVAWVPFRAETIEGAANMLSAMSGVNGLSLPNALAGSLDILEPWLENFGVVFNGMFYNGVWIEPSWGIMAILFLALIAVLTPNTQQIMGDRQTRISHRQWLLWQPNLVWALGVIIIFLFSVVRLDRISEFIYFQF